MIYLRFFWVRICLSVICSNITLSQENIPYYRLDPTTNTKGEMMLSELVESIEYIPLETTNKCLLGSIYYFDISDNYILVLCHKAKGCFLFNRKTGKFLTAIGKYGQGPGEYSSIPDNCMLDEKNQYVILISRTGMEEIKMKYYNLQGMFIKDMPFKNPAFPMGAQSRMISNSHILMMYSNFSIEIPHSYEIWSNEKIQKQAIKPLHEVFPDNSFYKAHFFTYSYQNRMFVKSSILNDTVYEVRNNNSFIPAFTMNNGSKEITFTDLKNSLNNWQNHSMIIPHRMFETKNYLLLSYFQKQKMIFFYYDKQKKQTFRLGSQTGIPNDYDGGLDFFPEVQYNNMFVFFHDAYTFWEQPAQEKKQFQSPPIAIQSFKKMIQKLAPEDNPVLMIVKMKQ